MTALPALSGSNALLHVMSDLHRRASHAVSVGHVSYAASARPLLQSHARHLIKKPAGLRALANTGMHGLKPETSQRTLRISLIATVAAVGAVSGLRAALAGVGADAREAGAARRRNRRVRVRNRQRAPRAICMCGNFALSGAPRTNHSISV